MANPNPVQTKKFKARQFQQKGDEPLGGVISLRFPKSVDEFLRGMDSGERSAFIREAVAQAMIESLDPDDLSEGQIRIRFPVGSQWKNPGGHVLTVAGIDGDRILVTGEFGADSYPPSMLSPL